MSPPAPRRAYLGIGSNLGDRLANLQSALDGLRSRTGIRVVAVSRVYETDPVGGPEQPEYLNAVVAVETSRPARDLLQIAQELETAAQRVRVERWGPRTLDVDVLLVGDETIAEPDLQVPHPRLWERGFVVEPLRDVAPAGTIPPETPVRWAGVRPTDLALLVPSATGIPTRGRDRSGA